MRIAGYIELVLNWGNGIIPIVVFCLVIGLIMYSAFPEESTKNSHHEKDSH